MVKTALILCLLLNGCTTMPAPVDDPRQVWCDQNSPRRDAMPETPRAELDDINAHYRMGVLWCRWRP